MKTKERLSKKLIMILIIIALAVLDIFAFAIQIVNAEEEETINAKPIIEGTIEKYINYNISDNAETLVQYHIRTGIDYDENSENFPITYTETVLYIGEIDGKYPYKVNVIMNSTETTNGNAKDNYNIEYDSDTGILIISIYNQDEDGNLISSEIPSEENRDDYTIICYYDTYTEEQPERTLDLNISTVMQLSSTEDRKVYGNGFLEKVVTENIEDITSVDYDTEDVYNGYIKSNIINGTEYNTQYTETESINISNKEIQQKIEITGENTFIRVSDEEVIEDLGNGSRLLYKSVKLERENITDILGEEGYIEILDTDGNVLSTINQDTEFAENGTFTVTWEDGIENIVIKTSDILNEGTLNIETTKEIQSTMQDIDNIKIKTTTNIAGITEEEIVEETESESGEYIEETKVVESIVYRTTNENIVDIQDSETNVEFSLDTDELTNEKQNEVTFKVNLQTNTSADNMFENPSIKIELPSQVEKVILSENSIMYANGLTLDEPYLETDEDGSINIVANLQGSSTGYNENSLGLSTTIEIKAILILTNTMENCTENINFIYTNEWTLNGETEELVDSKEVQLVSYQNIKTVEEVDNIVSTYATASLSAEDLEGVNIEVTPLKGSTEIQNGSTIYEGEYIKYTIKVTNTTDNDLTNVNVVASIPEGLTYGELETDYNEYFSDYEYNLDESVREKTIEIGTLKAGESTSVFYEVQANDLEDEEEEKEVTTQIAVYVEDQQAKSWEMTNTVKQADVQVFLSSSRDFRYDSGWNYDITITSEEEKEVTVKIYLPKEFELECVVYQSAKIDLDMEISENNVITTTLNTNNTYSFQGSFDQTKIDKEDGENTAEITAYAEVTTDNTYTSNLNIIEFKYQNITISMTSPTEGEEVRFEEEIVYEIEIQNIGGKNLSEADKTEANSGDEFIIVKITDFLPDEIEATTVTYNTWIVNDSLEITSTETVTTEINGIDEDENGERLPNVEEYILIPSGETSTITINATAGMVYEKTTISNSMTATGDEIETKTSNTVSHTILPYDYDDVDDDDNDDDTSDSDDSNTSNSSDNGSSDGLYSISGVVWNDSNEDGERQSDETLLSSVTVMLLDTNNSETIASTMQTNSNGEYTFSNIEQGNYIVIFQYDTEQYVITQYQASGVSESANSDAMDSTITLNGSQVNVGLTDEIELNSNATNIDLGLIERKTCDFKLDKYISKVTVKTSSGTVSEETYDNEDLAKVEIRSKEIEGATVIVEYKIVITNEGELASYVTKVIDYIPDGFEFSSELNSNWAKSSEGLINLSLSNRQIEAGESVELTLVLTKEMTANDTGTYTNAAEIGEITNSQNTSDVDSTPGNGVASEDDYSTADIIISVSTGAIIYISILIVVLLVMITIAYVIIKKKHINIRKVLRIGKMIVFVLVFSTIVFSQQITEAAYYYQRSYYFDYDEVANTTLHRFYWIDGPLDYAYCMNHDAEAYDGTFPYGGETTKITSTSTTKTGTFTLTKGNSTISMTTSGNYCIYGPFTVSCSVSGTYDIKVYDSNGNEISEVTTCNSSGTKITVSGSMSFYLKIAASKCENGISKVELSATRQVTTTVTSEIYTMPWYECTYSGGQDVQAGGYIYKDTDTSNSTSNKTLSISWTDFKGTLKITKVDKDNTSTTLSGVKIRVYNTSLGYDKTFTTDSSGEITINNLSIGKYTIEEVSNSNYGYSDLESTTAKVTSGAITSTTLKNTKQTGNLKIYKQDADNSSILLEGVSFKIQNSSGEYIIAVDSSGNSLSTVTGSVTLSNIETTTDVDSATEFITDSSGCITIKNIAVDTYTVTEMSVGDNFGYEIDDDWISWESSSSSGTGSTATITVSRQTSSNTSGSSSSAKDSVSSVLTFKNKKKYIKISGYAWEDRVSGKNSTRDDEWVEDSSDERLANVPVRLYNANGELLDETITDENGEYIFGNYDEDEDAIHLEIDDLVGAYVEFEYNGMSYQSIEVNTSFDTYTETTSTGSTITYLTGNTNKASDESFREEFNEKYATISQGISSDSGGNKTYDITYDFDEENHTSSVVWGDEVLYGYEGQTYPIANVYEQYTLTALTSTSTTNALCTDLTPDDIRENGVVEIGGVNLGVYRRDRPDLAVVEDVENVEISLNGYTHTYQYAQRYLDPEEYAGGDPFNVSVKFASKYISNSYSRAVYSSDIIWNQESENAGELDIRIRYTIQIRNESSTVYSSVNTLSNYYDDRYTVMAVYSDDGLTRDDEYEIITEYGQEITSYYSTDYSQTFDDGTGMKQVVIEANYLLAPGETRELIIEYKLDNDAVNAILNEDQTLDSVIEIASYSSYTDETATAPLAGIDIDSAPDTVVVTKNDDGEIDITDTTEDDSDKAPSIILELQEGRVISGTVWEDEALSEWLEQNQRIGNGIYDEGESVVENVTVELLVPLDSGGYELATLYQIGENVYDDLVTVDATTTTDMSGNYTFSGVIPDNYFIRYTYGDDSVVYSSDGDELYNIDVDDYKSTIYRGGDSSDPGDYWYQSETSGIEETRLSDAKDNDDVIDSRTSGNLDGTGGTLINNATITESETSFTEIYADTRLFNIKVDYDYNYDVEDYDYDSDGLETDYYTSVSEYDTNLVWVFDQIDFGIIERPEQSIEVDKTVSNIKVQLSNGSSLIDGDPNPPEGETDSPLSYVRVIDDNVYMEIDSELIQGATLTVTYAITVDNSGCEIDYDTEDYYIYGTVPDNPEDHYLIATVTDIFDYLPEGLVFESDNVANENWELIDDIEEWYEGGYLSEIVYEQVKDLSNIIHLTETGKELFASMTPSSTASANIVASRQLSITNDDLSYENDVEIVAYKNRQPIDSTPGNYDPTENVTYESDPDDPDDPDKYITVEGNEPDDDYLIVTITPPTGSDETIKYWMYGGLGVTLLAVMGTGIVLIKRKVL